MGRRACSRRVSGHCTIHRAVVAAWFCPLSGSNVHETCCCPVCLVCCFAGWLLLLVLCSGWCPLCLCAHVCCWMLLCMCPGAVCFGLLLLHSLFGVPCLSCLALFLRARWSCYTCMCVCVSHLNRCTTCMGLCRGPQHIIAILSKKVTSDTGY